MSAEGDFYASAGPMTELGSFSEELAGLGADPVVVAEAVQGLVLHRFWAEAYGVEVPAPREGELQIRAAADMVRRIVEIDGRPLSEPRVPEKRILGNCRHFSTLTVALLRRAGIPSRARCGFADYFEPGKWIDHWVVEYWGGSRWVMMDPQIDEFQKKSIGLLVDPADLPPGHFLVAGDAWARCRAGLEDSTDFGILDMWGWWFIEGNVARDLAALNKVEMLPWDGWGSLAGGERRRRDPAYVDEIAALTLSTDLSACRRRYLSDERLRVPPRVLSFTSDGPIEVDVPELR